VKHVIGVAAPALALVLDSRAATVDLDLGARSLPQLCRPTSWERRERQRFDEDPMTIQSSVDDRGQVIVREGIGEV
jgi:hypothetical protein